MFASHSKQTLVILIILTLGALGAWYFIYSSIVADASAAEQAAANSAAAATTANKDQSLEQFLTQSSSTAATLIAGIVPEDGSVPFIEQLEALAKGMGVGAHVDAVALSAPANAAVPANFENLNMSITIQGSWKNVYDFIALLESLPYKVDVSAVTINQLLYSAPGQKVPQSFWNGSVSFSILKFKGPDDAADSQ